MDGLAEESSHVLSAVVSLIFTNRVPDEEVDSNLQTGILNESCRLKK
jgi:hypothetical protein